ncbi:MAG: VOC family protein [Casimicrobiaceae bacterium]
MSEPVQPRAKYPRLHLAFPVTDLTEARRFYGEFLDCPKSRSSPEWVDLDFYGHQIVAHKVASGAMRDATRLIDSDQVPVRHFGVILSMSAWRELAAKLQAAKTKFVIELHVRFQGLAGERATMFFLDPFGNALEFKAFENIGQLFTRQ